jgi:hypothetical protein
MPAPSFDLPTKPEIPTTEQIAPPIRSQTVLSVGERVKKRDGSDPKDSDARVPYTTKTTPTTRNAMDKALFMRPSPVEAQNAYVRLGSSRGKEVTGPAEIMRV